MVQRLGLGLENFLEYHIYLINFVSCDHKIGENGKKICLFKLQVFLVSKKAENCENVFGFFLSQL